jgi:hypothetical protein
VIGVEEIDMGTTQKRQQKANTSSSEDFEK